MELSPEHGRTNRSRGIDIAWLGNAVPPGHSRLSRKVVGYFAAAVGIHPPAWFARGAASDGGHSLSGVEAAAGTRLLRAVLPCSRLGFGSNSGGYAKPGALLGSAVGACGSAAVETEKGNLGTRALGEAHVGGCSGLGGVALYRDNLFDDDIARDAFVFFPSLGRSPGGHARPPIVCCGGAGMGRGPATTA